MKIKGTLLFFAAALLLLAPKSWAGATIEIGSLIRVELRGVYTIDGQKFYEAEKLLQAADFAITWNEAAYRLSFKNKKGTGLISTLSPYVAFKEKIFHLGQNPRFIDSDG